MKNRSKLVKSVTAVSTAAVMVAQMLCSILPVSAETVAYDKGTVSVELSSDRQYLNISGKVEDKQNIQDVSVYEMPSFQDEQNTDYSSLTPIGVAGTTESGGAAEQEKPDAFVIEDFENGANGWEAKERAVPGSGLVKEFYWAKSDTNQTVRKNDSSQGKRDGWTYWEEGLMPASGSHYFRARKGSELAIFPSFVGKEYANDKLLDLAGYSYIQFYLETPPTGPANYRAVLMLKDVNGNKAYGGMDYSRDGCYKQVIAVTIDLDQSKLHENAMLGGTAPNIDRSRIKEIWVGWSVLTAEQAWSQNFSIDGIIATKEKFYLNQFEEAKYEAGDPPKVATDDSRLKVLETNFEGWQAGENTSKIEIKTAGSPDNAGFGDRNEWAAISPFELYAESEKVIIATKAAVDSRSFSEVYKEYAAGQELDLSKYRSLMFDVNKPSGASVATKTENYVVRLTLTAADGTTHTVYQPVVEGNWHTVGFNIAEFAGRNQIKRIGVAFALSQWAPSLQKEWAVPFSISSMVGSTTGAPYDTYAKETELFGFETGYEGWEQAEKTARRTVTGADQPVDGNPLTIDTVRGNKMLKVVKQGNVPANEYSFVERKFDAPLDLSRAQQLVYNHLTLGGAGDAYTKIVITTADGQSYEKEYKSRTAGYWCVQEVDLTAFGDLSQVVSIKLGFRASLTANWPGSGYFDNITVRGDYVFPQDTLDDFEEGLNGWTHGERTNKNASLLDESGSVYQGGKMLTAGMDGSTYANDPHYVQKEFSTPKDLSAYRKLSFAINGMGGATLTNPGYIAHLRLTGKDGTQKSYIQYIKAGEWVKVSFDISRFAEIGQVSKIEIGYSAVDANALPAGLNGCWPGGFSIDDIQLAKEWQTPAERYANGTLEENGSFSFQIPLEEVADITDKFVVAATYNNGTVKLVDHFKYITNPEVLAENDMPFPDPGTIKGLGGSLAEDMRNNTRHAAYNISIGRLLTMTNHGSQTIVYYYNGKPYYFNKQSVDDMDKNFSKRTNNGIVNYGILLLHPHDMLDADSPYQYLRHPDASDDANFAAVNLLDQRSVDYYGAIVSFLAQRYNGDHSEYGRVAQYIVGNEITDQINWNNMGNKTLDQFIEQYEWQLRMTNTLVKSAAKNAVVYVPVEHSWNIAPSNGYKGKELFEKLNECTKAAGDYGWNVAYHAYPANMADPRTWRDDVTDNFNTPKITFKNIQVLPQFFRQSNMKYNGTQRRIALTEQGFHTRYTELDEETAEIEQAAGYAYGYYKIATTEGIDAFLLHRFSDGTDEGDWRFGVWTRMEGTVSQPDRPKKIRDVLKYIDTEKSKEATQFALDFIIKDMGKEGVWTKWSDLIPELTDQKFNELFSSRPAPVSVNAGYPSEEKNEEVITEGSLDNWSAKQMTKNLKQADDAENNRKVVKADIVSSSILNAEYYGLTYQPESPLDFSTKPVLAVTLQAENVGGYQKGVKYIFRVCSGSRVLEGTAESVADQWETLAIDLSDFEGKNSVDRIDVWAAPLDSIVWQVGSISIAKIAKLDKTEIKKLTFTSDVDKVTTEGQKVKFTVTNKGNSEINDTITFKSQNGLTLDVTSQQIKLAVNESKTFTVTVKGLDKVPENKYGAVWIELNGLSEMFRLTDVDYADYVADGNDWVLGDFEDIMTDGWVIGDYAKEMASVTKSSQADGAPSAAQHGDFCLEIKRVPTVCTTPGYAVKNFKKPLDLTEHSLLSLEFCGWGGTSRLYTVDIIVTASDGTQKTYTKWMQHGNTWQNYTIDISDFAKRDSVASVAVGFYGFDKYYYTYNWPGNFYLDNIRALSGKGNLKPETEYEKMLEPITTITDSAGKVAVSGLSVLPGSQLTKAEYATSGSAYDSEAQLAAQFKQAKLMGVYQLQTKYGEEDYTPTGVVEICLPLPTGYNASKKYMIAHALSDGTTAYIFPQVENGKFKFEAAGMGNFAVWSADSESAFRVAE